MASLAVLEQELRVFFVHPIYAEESNSREAETEPASEDGSNVDQFECEVGREQVKEVSSERKEKEFNIALQKAYHNYPKKVELPEEETEGEVEQQMKRPFRETHGEQGQRYVEKEVL